MEAARLRVRVDFRGRDFDFAVAMPISWEGSFR
jgi:hypothetical protein